MKFLRNNRRVLAALAVVLLLVFAISYTNQQRGTVTVFETMLIELLAPVQGVAEQATDAVQGTIQGISNLGELQAENQRLRERLREVSQLEIEAYELRRENLELKQLLGLVQGRYGQIDNARMVATARVIGRNPDNWFRYVQVDKGADDGVTVDMVVILPPRILVGRVIKVTPRTAMVMLISDPESGVGGLAQRNRDAGIVLGSSESGDVLDMEFFSRDADPYEGQVVMTSGLGELFPPDLLIGTIQNTGFRRQGVLPVASIDPFADLDHLDYLVIIERLGR